MITIKQWKIILKLNRHCLILKKKNGTAVINYDDEYGKKLTSKINCDVALFSKN